MSTPFSCKTAASSSALAVKPPRILAMNIHGMNGSLWSIAISVRTLFRWLGDGLRAQHRLKFYQYADNCQIYVTTSPSAINQLSHCLHDVESTSGWVWADYAWTPARHKSCGSAPGITSTNSRFMKYQSCRLLSKLSAQHATSALSLTAGCQWPTTWRQSVVQHTITCGRLDPHCSLCHVTLQRH